MTGSAPTPQTERPGTAPAIGRLKPGLPADRLAARRAAARISLRRSPEESKHQQKKPAIRLCRVRPRHLAYQTNSSFVEATPRLSDH